MTVQQQAVRSKRVAQATGLTLIDQGVRLIKQAGAPSEGSYERDGFLSYHAETHAVGAGIGIGFALGASGELRLLGGFLTLVLAGNDGVTLTDKKLTKDIRQEPHYFLGGLVTGALLGVGARAVSGSGVGALV